MQARIKPKILSTLGPNPSGKARPDLQLCGGLSLSSCSRNIHGETTGKKNYLTLLQLWKRKVAVLDGLLESLLLSSS